MSKEVREGGGGGGRRCGCMELIYRDGVDIDQCLDGKWQPVVAWSGIWKLQLSLTTGMYLKEIRTPCPVAFWHNIDNTVLPTQKFI